MQWHSLNDFLAMGGYAFYVWGSVAACAVAMLVEPIVLKRTHKRLLRSMRPGRGTPAGTGGQPQQQQRFGGKAATESTR